MIADLMAGFDSHIALQLYPLAPTSVEDALAKAKLIEMGQKNAAGMIQQNARINQLEEENNRFRQQIQQAHLSKPIP